MNMIEILINGSINNLIANKNMLSYLDPGTGSMIIQVLIAAICGGLLSIKLFWHRIKDIFTKLFKHKKKKNAED